METSEIESAIEQYESLRRARWYAPDRHTRTAKQALALRQALEAASLACQRLAQAHPAAFVRAGRAVIFGR